MAGLPASLQPVKGDPDGVKSAGRAYGTSATAISRSGTALGKAGTQAVGALKGPRAKSFAAASGAAVVRIESLASNLHMASTALNGYGTALHAVKEAVDDHAGKWEDEQAIIDRYQGSEDPDAPTKVSDARRAQGRHEHAGEEARREFRGVAQRTASALNGMTGALVPGGSGMTPQAVLDEALGGWKGIVRGAGQNPANLLNTGKNAFDLGSALKDLAENPGHVKRIKDVLNAWSDQKVAATIAKQTRNLEQAKVAAVVRLSGKGSYAALRQYMTAKEITSLTDAVRDTTRAASASKLSKLAAGLKAGSKFAKGVAVLGIVSGAIEVFNPSHKGWRGAGDRVAGAVGAGTGAVMLLQTAGLMAAFGPVGAGVFVGLVAAAALWTVGNFVADHWDDIKKGVAAAGGFIAKKTDEAFTAVKKDMEKKYDAAKKVIGTGIDTGKKVVEGGYGLAKKGYGYAEQGFNEVGDRAGKVADGARDKIGSFADGAKGAVDDGLGKVGIHL